MHEIHNEEASPEFAECWQAAGRHLEQQAQGPLRSWLRAHLAPPFLEHLSFRLGNQLFFIRIEDVDQRIESPGNRDLLHTVADGCKGHPCILAMRRRSEGWVPDHPGWGLIHARTGAAVDPPRLITDELIEITDWELHDFAMQIVRNKLERRGRQVTSWISDPRLDPSVWFLGDQGLEWGVVRAVRFPTLRATVPDNWVEIAESCARYGGTGHFASVSLASKDDAFDPTGEVPATPLWRGHAVVTNYQGLERVDGTRHEP